MTLRVLLGLYMVLLVAEPVLKLKPLATIGGDFDLSYNLSALFIFNILFFLKYLSNNIRDIHINKSYLLLLLLFIFSFIFATLTNPQSLLFASSLLVQFLLQITVILYLGTIYNRRKLLSFFLFLQFFAFINCLFVYASYFFPNAVGSFTEIHGFFGYAKGERPDYIRAFGVMGDAAPWFLSFFACWHLQFRQYLRYFFYAGSAVLGSSFGASLLVLVMTYFSLLLSAKNKIRLHLWLVGGLVLLTGTILLIKPEIITQVSLIRRLNDTKVFSEGSGIQRLFSVGLAFEYIMRNPFWGYGYGTYLYNLRNDLDYFFDNLDFGYGAVSNANNQFLQTWYEFGLIGLVVVFFILRYVFRKMRLFTSMGKIQEPLLEFKKAAFVWTASLLLANQTAVYTIPGLFWVLICVVIGSCFAINKIIRFESITYAKSTRNSGV